MTRKIEIPTGGAGGVDAVPGLLDGEPGAEWLLVVAPGAGAPADSELLTMLASGLARSGTRVLRFDFPYQVRARDEHRRRPPDRGPVLLATWHAVLAHVARWYRPRRLAVGGKSMGGRYATMLLAEAGEGGGRRELAAEPHACVLFGYPLHPPGRPDRLRVQHLASVKCPMLFLAGTRDSLAHADELRSVTRRLPLATLAEVADAGHDFAVPKSSGRSRADVVAELVEQTATFLEHVPP